MLFEDHSKIDMLIKMIGTREDYTNTVKLSHLTSEEKDILMTASVQLKKKKQNTPITDRAYEILFGKQAGGTAQTKTQPAPQSESVASEPTKEPVSESKIDFGSSSNDTEDELDDIYGFKND